MVRICIFKENCVLHNLCFHFSEPIMQFKRWKFRCTQKVQKNRRYKWYLLVHTRKYFYGILEKPSQTSASNYVAEYWLEFLILNIIFAEFSNIQIPPLTQTICPRKIHATTKFFNESPIFKANPSDRVTIINRYDKLIIISYEYYRLRVTYVRQIAKRNTKNKHTQIGDEKLKKYPLWYFQVKTYFFILIFFALLLFREQKRSRL